MQDVLYWRKGFQASRVTIVIVTSCRIYMLSFGGGEAIRMQARFHAGHCHTVPLEHFFFTVEGRFLVSQSPNFGICTFMHCEAMPSTG